MLNLTLEDQILTFIKRLLVVKERHLYKFFREDGDSRIQKAITNLQYLQLIFKHEDCYSTVRKLNSSLYSYSDIWAAADVMCLLPSPMVREFVLLSYPFELTFITDDNYVYDITVFDHLNLTGKYASTKRFRAAALPPGMEDTTRHIAVVGDESMIDKLEPLNYYMYAQVDRNGHVTTWSYEDESE